MMQTVDSSRRDILGGVAACGMIATACGQARRKPNWITYLLRMPPGTLDPAKSGGGSESWIINALFEPLLQQHPVTQEPIAGLVTHYKVDKSGTLYTFYLRGHGSPDGVKLPGTESVPQEFSQGRHPPSDHVPARWSDGVAITAADVVFSWRRYLAPETGNVWTALLEGVKGARDVIAGKRPPARLGLRTLDEFSFEVELEAPAPHLLMLCYSYSTLPLPRHAIVAARRRGREDSWIEPGHIVTSGPFLLNESRPRERTVVVRNPNYYDAGPNGIEGIEFVAADGAVVLNLFRAGMADAMESRALPLQLAQSLKYRADFHARPALANHNWRFSAKRPPLDNVLLRYALNMATDKAATARLLGTGQMPAKSRVPPLNGYRSPERLEVNIGGRTCDVLAFDPRTARELWLKAAPAGGIAPFPIYHFALHDSAILAELLRSQWRTHLGIETRFVPMEPQAYIKMVLNDGDFTGVAEDSWVGDNPDPTS
ncbi:MAG: peptide ABC transporter substrate-binding protein, partial [Bryobacteraceae bacterium]